MANDSRKPSASQSGRIRAEQELFHAILDEREPYPWQPHAPQQEAYFSELETEWGQVELAPEERQTRWQAFSTQLQALWAEAPALEQTTLFNLLKRQFQDRMPDVLLQQISQQAMALVRQGDPLIDRLVTCVHNLMPEWDPEDLAVLARPLAYSLRDGREEVLDLTLRSVRSTEWDSLSAIERARLGLAITCYALSQAQALEQDS
ncbi:hypothetical protein XM38_041570 [Halomicronema hongdechloris C2206]|uniref:Uncharacterized protein n=1 Tax=Halomicronema hongdechloris C2206 TaxID=1641165 RepID=A0A1Z3HSC0_9CYAN|nr:hypothetical protein [Halomicronema hongdechloris]ASC73195.1 hypothetical protein XM38_041570 [Halomicronema hongdechloris C2206]